MLIWLTIYSPQIINSVKFATKWISGHQSTIHLVTYILQDPNFYKSENQPESDQDENQKEKNSEKEENSEESEQKSIKKSNVTKEPKKIIKRSSLISNQSHKSNLSNKSKPSNQKNNKISEEDNFCSKCGTDVQNKPLMGRTYSTVQLPAKKVQRVGDSNVNNSTAVWSGLSTRVSSVAPLPKSESHAQFSFMEQRPTTYLTNLPQTNNAVSLIPEVAPVMDSRRVGRSARFSNVERPVTYSASPIQYGAGRFSNTYGGGVNYSNVSPPLAVTHPVVVSPPVVVNQAPTYSVPLQQSYAPTFAETPLMNSFAAHNSVPVYKSYAPMQSHASYYPNSGVYDNYPVYRDVEPYNRAPAVRSPYPTSHYPYNGYQSRVPRYARPTRGYNPGYSRSLTPIRSLGNGYTVEEREYVDYDGDGIADGYRTRRF